MTYQIQFKQLVERYILEVSTEDEEKTEEERKQTHDFFDNIYQRLEDIQKIEPNFVLIELEACLTKLDIWVLHILVDFVRTGCSPSAKFEKTLDILLILCFRVLESYKEIEAHDPFYFISQTYETIWHTGLEHYDGDLYRLYFDLTYELLDDKYFVIEDEENQDRYSNSVFYWILMSNYHFRQDPHDFKEIFSRLKQNPNYRSSDHLIKRWEEYYEEVNK